MYSESFIFAMFTYQILDLKKKQESQVQLLKQKQKSDEAAKRLQDEIQSIKAQKVYTHAYVTFLCGFYPNIYLCPLLLFIFSKLLGSIATKDKTRSRTIPAVESLSREGIAAGIYFVSFFLCFPFPVTFEVICRFTKSKTPAVIS